MDIALILALVGLSIAVVGIIGMVLVFILLSKRLDRHEKHARAESGSASSVTASVDDKWANQFGNGRGGLPAEENWDAQQAAAEEVTRRVGQGKDKEQIKSEQLGGIH